MDAKIWSDLFHPDVSVIEKIARPIIVYVFLVVGLRLAGKRELAQLNTGDLIVLLTLSNTVQNAIIGNDNSVIGGIIGASTLLIVNYIWTRLLFKHQKLNRLVEGEPDALIEGGQIKHDRLKKEQLTLAELEIAGNKQGLVRSMKSIAPCWNPADNSHSPEKSPHPRPSATAKFSRVWMR